MGVARKVWENYRLQKRLLFFATVGTFLYSQGGKAAGLQNWSFPARFLSGEGGGVKTSSAVMKVLHEHSCYFQVCDLQKAAPMYSIGCSRCTLDSSFINDGSIKTDRSKVAVLRGPVWVQTDEFYGVQFGFITRNTQRLRPKVLWLKCLTGTLRFRLAV